MSQKIKTSVEIDGSLTASQIANATTDTDKFLVSDGGTVKYRTGAELASDLGIASGSTSKVQHQVKAGVAINKGQAVYVTSADGTNMIVGLASNASEATSSKTMGLLNATVVANGFADVITEGLLDGLDTSTATVGNPVWLGTGGNLIYGLANKPYAPNHLVFIGIVTRVNANNGEIFVKVQNGFELDEIHDVDLKTTAKINGHLLGYNGSLWVNKTIAEWLGYTPYNASNPAGYISSYTETDTLASVTSRGATTSTLSTFDGGLNIGNAKLRWGGNTSPTLGFPFTGGPNAFWIDVNDGDTGGIAIDNDGTTIYGAGDSGHVFRVIDEDVYQATSNVDASTTFRIQQGQNGGGYVRGNFEITGTLTASGYNKTNWDTAFGWGNHASAGYITSYTETDTLASVTSRGAGTSSNVTFSGITRLGGSGYKTYIEGGLMFRDYGNNTLTNGRFYYQDDAWHFRGGGEGEADVTSDTAMYIRSGNIERLVLHDGNISSYAVPTSRTITINGTSYDLSTNRSWTVTASETDTLQTVTSRGNVTSTPIILRTSYPYLQFEDNVTGSVNFAWQQLGVTLGGSGTNGGGYFTTYSQSKPFGWTVGTNQGVMTIDTSGNVQALTSSRAPIFYDSNDTAFYLDPASTSKISKLYIRNGGAAGVGWSTGLVMGDDSNYWNFIQDAGVARQRNFGAGGYDWFSSSAGTQLMLLNNGGTLSVSSDVRSTVFYDSNNTGYYCDPASTTRLNALTLSSLASDDGMIENNTGAYFHLGGWGVGRTAATAVLVNTAYRSDISDSTPWSGITGKPDNIMYYSGFTLDANTMATNTTGFTYSVNAPFTGPIARFSTNGGYDMWINSPYSGGGTGFAFRTRNGDAGTINPWRYPAVYDVNVNGGGVLYATALIDQNDTTYYIDPNATSTSYRGRGEIFLGPNTSAQYLRLGGNGGMTDHSTVSTSNGNLHIDAKSGNNLYLGWYNSSDVMVGGGMQSLIYYDRNNTGYYVDPASTSYVNAVDARSYISSGNPWSTGNSAWFPNGITTPSVTSWMYGTVYLGNAPGNGSGTEANSSGQIMSTGDHRASIFYEYSNTGYYLDPASTSNLNAVNVNGNLQVWGAGGNYNEGIRLVSGTGSWSNIQFGANSSGSSTQANQWIVGKMPSGVFVMSLAGNQDSGSRLLIDQYGGLLAPVYYDGNNTQYYVDPASTSRLGTVNSDLLRSYSNLYLDYQYGATVVGVYSSYRFQGVFAMGDSYKLATDGTNCADHYGIAWSHPNAGGQAANLSSHGALIQISGITRVALSTNIWCQGDIIAYSDARVKDNVQVIDNPLERLKKVRGVTFTRNDLEDKEKRYAGVIAQEMIDALPEVVTENADGHLSVSYGNSVSLLIECIKEQQTQIEELKELVNKLINK